MTLEEIRAVASDLGLILEDRAAHMIRNCLTQRNHGHYYNLDTEGREVFYYCRRQNQKEIFGKGPANLTNDEVNSLINCIGSIALQLNIDTLCEPFRSIDSIERTT